MIPPFNEFVRTIIFKEFKPLPLSSDIFFPAHPPLAECPVTLYQQTSFKFPALIKNKDVLRQNLNFSLPGCPPPSGHLRPSDTMSTNQFQISRANKKKQGCPPNLIPPFNEFFTDACLKRNLNETFPNGSIYPCSEV